MLATTGRSNALAIDGPREADPRDVPELIALVDAEMRPDGRQSLLTDYPLVYDPANLSNVRILRVDGRLVSVVSMVPRDAIVAGRTTRIGVISPTATAPAERHRGYASRCLESAVEAMVAAGCSLSVLWTLEATFPFYEQLGWRPVRPQGVRYQLRRDDVSRFTPDPSVAVGPFDPADGPTLDAIARMHERDRDAICRSAGEYRALLALPRMRTLVALRERRPQGYLVVSDASNKPGILEAGGDRAAIETLVHHVLATLPGERIDAHAPLAQTALSTVLERRVPARRALAPDGLMVRVNDIRALLGPVNEDLSRAEWALALFGSHPRRPFTPPAGLGRRLGVALPLDLAIPVLDRS